jgi:hypothetical protein
MGHALLCAHDHRPDARNRFAPAGFHVSEHDHAGRPELDDLSWGDIAASLVRRKFYDFAKTGTSLKPGGTYAASLGPQRTVFLIDRRAEPGPTPIIGRLVRLE